MLSNLYYSKKIEYLEARILEYKNFVAQNNTNSKLSIQETREENHDHLSGRYRSLEDINESTGYGSGQRIIETEDGSWVFVAKSRRNGGSQNSNSNSYMRYGSRFSPLLQEEEMGDEKNENKSSSRNSVKR